MTPQEKETALRKAVWGSMRDRFVLYQQFRIDVTRAIGDDDRRSAEAIHEIVSKLISLTLDDGALLNQVESVIAQLESGSP